MSVSTLPPVMAIIAVDEVGHGLVSTLDLVLNKAGAWAATLLTGEEPREALATLLLDSRHFPVSASLHEASVVSFFPVFDSLLACKLANIGGDDFL